MLLLNMVTADELYDDQDYKEILEDITDECGKYGEVEGVRVPRPVPKSKRWEPSDSATATAEKNRKADEEAGVGRVYVLYKEIEMTQKAMKAIGGRQFAGRTILVASVPEVSAAAQVMPCQIGGTLRIQCVLMIRTAGRILRACSSATTARRSRGGCG